MKKLLLTLLVAATFIAATAQDRNEHLKQAKGEIGSSNPEPAIEILTKLISQNPNDTAAYYYRAEAYELHAQIQNQDDRFYLKAIEDYNQVLKLDPSHYKAYWNRFTVKTAMVEHMSNGFTKVDYPQEKSTRILEEALAELKQGHELNPAQKIITAQDLAKQNERINNLRHELERR